MKLIRNYQSAIDYSHGNVKDKTAAKSFVRVCPSVIQSIKETNPVEFPSKKKLQQKAAALHFNYVT